MKKLELLGAVLLISAMFVCSNAYAYYDFEEIQGKNGTEVVISVSKKQPVKQAEAASVKKEGAKSTKESILAKYNLTPADKPQIKPKETEIVVMQSAQKENEMMKASKNPRIAINTVPAEQNLPQKTETSYNKIEQPAQEQFEAKIEQNHKYYTNWSNEEAERIVTRIGNNLKSASGLDIALNYFVLNEEEVNACTDIDNNIYIFEGILPYVETEDELAFIIGHEMGHAASKHVVKSIVTNEVAGVANAVGKDVLRSKVTNAAASKISGLGFGLGGVASAAVVGAGNLAVDAATSATVNTVDRGRENDADLLAIDYLVKKGYNPLAGISIMAKIGDVYPDLFSDHPSTDKRVVTMYRYIQKKYPQYIAKGFGTDAYGMAVAQYVKKR